ncbi:MAG: hypothetical protein AAFR61_13575 [Bacteroidota bacterium]
MKKRIRQLLLGGLLTMVLLGISVVVFLLNPQLSYAQQTPLSFATLYHDTALSPQFLREVEASLAEIRASLLWQEDAHFRICLPGPGTYAERVESLLGPDVIRSFADISVMQAEFAADSTTLLWREAAWPVSTMLAHSMTHSLQFKHHGFWDANPLGGHPEWKWEGFAEWAAWGKGVSMDSLKSLFHRTQGGPWEYLAFSSGQGSMRQHIQYLLCCKYLLEEEKLDYSALMSDSQSMEAIWHQVWAID